MPWRRPKKQVERPIDVRRSLEESLETAAEGEEEEDLVELVDIDGASITEAATGDPMTTARLGLGPTEIADKLRESLSRAAPVTAPTSRAVPHAPPGPRYRSTASIYRSRSRAVCGCKNPVLTASGTFGQGIEYAELIDVTRLGAIVNKGTTPRARPGNPQYRIAETPAGILNSIGLENPGAEEVARKYGKLWAKLGVPVIVNVAGYSVEDYVFVVEALDGHAGSDRLRAQRVVPEREGRDAVRFGSRARRGGDARGQGRDRQAGHREAHPERE